MIEVVDCYSGRWRYKPNLDKVKINKMETKEDKNNDTGVKHILRKEGGFRTVAANVGFWPCCTILNGYHQTEKDMDKKPGKKYDFENFDQGIGSHEGCCLSEHKTPVIIQKHKINAEMHTQKCNQKKPGKSHEYFFGNRRKHEHDVHTMVYIQWERTADFILCTSR